MAKRDNWTIKVIVEDGFGGKVAEAWVPIDQLKGEVFQMIKLSDSPMPFFDTPPAAVQRVMGLRDNLATYLAPQITKVLMEAMGANDTFNGYNKAEQKAMRG